jgi:hypothetical protein
MTSLTVASQQIRTSYRALGVRPSSKNQLSTPLGESVAGKEAFSLVLTVE